MSRLLIVSDLHLRQRLPYSDFVTDGRESEKEKVLRFITEKAAECDAVVFNGDNLNSRINSSDVIARFVRLLESFGDKKVFIVSGNHETLADGTSALDFLNEISGKANWHVFVREVRTVYIDNSTGLTFCPYFHRQMVNAASQEEWQERVMTRISPEPGQVLFIHHSISNCGVSDYVSTDSFQEPVLDKATLEEKFKMVIGGHIHRSGDYGNTRVMGNVFNSEINDGEKTLAILDTSDMSFTRIPVPCRRIYSLDYEAGGVQFPGTDQDIYKLRVPVEMDPEEKANAREAIKGYRNARIVEFGSRARAHDLSEASDPSAITLPDLLRKWAKVKGVEEELLLEALVDVESE